MDGDMEKEQRLKEQVELTKKQRNLQQDRKAFSNETQSKLRKMQTTIARLKKDYQNLVDELIARDATMQRNKSDMQKLISDDEEIKRCKREIAEEEEKQKDLDMKMSTLRQMILSEKEKLGGINATRDDYMHVQKQIRILENRLDKANQKFNDAMTHNNKLKAQIDSLRRERVIFENIYKRLEGELRKRREEMASKIEEANRAYEERDKAQEETNLLMQESAKNKENIDKMMESLKADLKRKTQLSLARAKKDEDKELLAQDRDDESLHGRGDDPWSASAKASTQDIVKEYSAYRQAFAQIEAATKVTRIEELVEKFEKAEQENFELFNFVNQLSAEIEGLEAQIKEMQAQVQQYEGLEHSQEKTSEKIHRDEEELARIEIKIEAYESKCQKSMKMLNSVKPIIENLFTNLECYKNDIPELLGSHGVTDSNIMAYIGAIERRREEMFQACREYIERKKDAGELLDLDPAIADLNEVEETKAVAESSPEKVTEKELNELLAQIPQNEFDLDSDIPTLNEISKRLEKYVAKDRPGTAFPTVGQQKLGFGL